MLSGGSLGNAKYEVETYTVPVLEVTEPVVIEEYDAECNIEFPSTLVTALIGMVIGLMGTAGGLIYYLIYRKFEAREEEFEKKDMDAVINSTPSKSGLNASQLELRNFDKSADKSEFK